MPKAINLIGYKFGRLVAINRIRKYKSKHTYYYCICECGGYNIVSTSHLTGGKIKSCGCYKIDNKGTWHVTHGLKHSDTYNLWCYVKSRCFNKNTNCYHHYGGRGIYMYRKWINDPLKFHEWCIENGYKKGLHIDRKDNDDGYYPWNCRFVTSKENCRNKRNNFIINYNGESKTLVEWSEIIKKPYNTLYHRLKKKNMSVGEAFNT